MTALIANLKQRSPLELYLGVLGLTITAGGVVGGARRILRSKSKSFSDLVGESSEGVVEGCQEGFSVVALAPYLFLTSPFLLGKWAYGKWNDRRDNQKEP